MRSIATNIVVILAIILAIHIPQTTAQFGVVRDKGAIKELLLKHQAQVAAEVSADGQADVPSFLSPQDAADMEELIRAATQDRDTMEMVAKMKVEMGDEIDALGKEPSDSILKGMKTALDEIKMLDYLFKDPKRAVVEMEKDGLIGEDKKKLKEYKKNPELLEADTRKGLYFSFISLAVAGGYI